MFFCSSSSVVIAAPLTRSVHLIVHKSVEESVHLSHSAILLNGNPAPWMQTLCLWARVKLLSGVSRGTASKNNSDVFAATFWHTLPAPKQIRATLILFFYRFSSLYPHLLQVLSPLLKHQQVQLPLPPVKERIQIVGEEEDEAAVREVRVQEWKEQMEMR